MAEKKVALMVLSVDLGCSDCYKNIRKILAKFPEIRDQVYDKNKNEVNITAVCCCPEKTRDKLYEKGEKVIKCIKIIEPPRSSNTATETEPEPPPVQITGTVEGVPVPGNYYPRPILWLCPMCSGGVCPWCYGYRKFIPQPPPASQFHNYCGHGNS